MAENVRIRNIYYMLSYAYQGLHETGYEKLASEEFDHIHDLFAAILCLGIGSQFKRGLHRDYISLEEPLSGVRGQIKVTETMKVRTLPQGKLICAFDNFSEDIQYNQIIKSTLLLLLHHGSVKPVHKQGLRKLLLYLGNVSTVDIRSIRWSSISYSRNCSSYRMLINICQLVARGLLQTMQNGEDKLSKWIQDEEMYRLFERFVLAFYRKKHPELHPAASYVDWDIPNYEDRSLLPIMRTDITLTRNDFKLIIDTKFFGKTLQKNSLYGSMSFISGNLYQIYTYVKNSDPAGTGNVAGILLYAKTDESLTPNQQFTMGGNRIGLRTLDLDCDWQQITEQLERICDWFPKATAVGIVSRQDSNIAQMEDNVHA